jgi:hypothetical protein
VSAGLSQPLDLDETIFVPATLVTAMHAVSWNLKNAGTTTRVGPS